MVGMTQSGKELTEILNGMKKLEKTFHDDKQYAPYHIFGRWADFGFFVGLKVNDRVSVFPDWADDVNDWSALVAVNKVTVWDGYAAKILDPYRLSEGVTD